MSEWQHITLEVQRYHPEQDAAPRWQRYTVPYTPDMSVLEGLQYIKDHLDGTLTFRWSCRMAICGSCGCMIDGEPELACHVFLRDYAPGPVRVTALDHFPIQRDLVIDHTDFLEKLETARAYLIPADDRTPADGTYRQTPEEMSDYYAYAQCINCLLCYAACPQYGWHPDFLGPGILALVQRYNLDHRDGGSRAREGVVDAEEGVWGCTLVGYCSEVCPKGVDPARAINQNKPASSARYLLDWLRPGGRKREGSE
ncbi:succinate dehydrogenase/fumarate reductase iron-sulfur subunit [Halorhodospira halophila]|uniref:Fumarate reductase iron-sulfur subunit n=1 Tax=Halorhodospira halophila (strain DSM 244 / SL1) TaxID=349124 RepID=A1WX04_HALHL|nr:succinate dehydrogenase/fumarate reductase iron-sulfur subunit [Halorhodospira halophila]ABM62216.1 succinate dehydrogenase subunit B [Halorhodospira halophila SL1]MBK1729191.1 succinate dehydrogenase/fumarate reductase iron-sulfur subunit [Halorhodospira halophila]